MRVRVRGPSRTKKRFWQCSWYPALETNIEVSVSQENNLPYIITLLESGVKEVKHIVF